jgi:adenine-specific DNA-methyltransferase
MYRVYFYESFWEGKLISESILAETAGFLSFTDLNRKEANTELEVETKSMLGQYMTSSDIASFMASLFPEPTKKTIKLLDPGAGVGSLTSAFLDRFCTKKNKFSIELTAYEIDSVMNKYLKTNLALFEKIASEMDFNFSWEIVDKDFVIEKSRKLDSLNSLFKEDVKTFTHCIMNPPYKKIKSSSRHRTFLRKVGIETVNLYSAFVALSLLLLEENGYLVAIIPRSFCNGPYYLPFRKFLLSKAAVKRIHLFDSRNKAFKEDKVLQENIIIGVEKGGIQKDVIVSTSTDDSFSDLFVYKYSFDKIVKKEDKYFFIHIPSSSCDFEDFPDKFNFSLSDIGLNISTGPVVDFRVKEHICDMPEKNCVPLIYPCHIKNGAICWPIKNGKKPNAIIFNSHTKKWLYPNGFYTVVRRFSSKEEKRRIVAGIIEPDLLGNAEKIGIENHLNFFHDNKKPLTQALSKGLCVYLNSTMVDEYFRRFSGHTQVNAADLKLMKYPSRENLVKLGKWASGIDALSQEIIDKEVLKISK